MTTQEMISTAKAYLPEYRPIHPSITCPGKTAKEAIVQRLLLADSLETALAAANERIRKLWEAATFARRGCAYNSMFAECEVLDEVLVEIAPDAKKAVCPECHGKGVTGVESYDPHDPVFCPCPAGDKAKITGETQETKEADHE